MKGKRLESNWKTFQDEHPEIKVVRNPITKKILSIRISEDIESYFIIYNRKTVKLLDFVTVNGEHFYFPR